MRRFNKIFGIGLTRTGTTSLTAALNQLGIPTIHWPTSFEEICEYRGATDITISSRFKVLDQLFPGSLFIHTIREKASWLDSVIAHYKLLEVEFPLSSLPDGKRQFASEADIRVYGSLNPGKADFLKTFKRHHSDVGTYFSQCPKRVLTMDIVAGDGWQSPCPFLEIPIPKRPFPYLHWRMKK